jgi:hypothetical protein
MYALRIKPDVIGPTGVYVLETKDWRGTVGFGPQGALFSEPKQERVRCGHA